MAGIIGSGSGVISRILYEPKELKEDAYKIEVPKEAAGGGEAKAEPEKPIGTMLASANVQQGGEISKKCQACHNLQKGAGARQDADFRDRVLQLTDPDFMGAEEMLDTAALIQELDLVVTSDTVTAHLAGALGASVWVALSTSPDWRWLTEREDSPWYPNMRLFRQHRRGDWAAVFERIAAELAGRHGHTG